MAPGARLGEVLDVALDNATPVLEFTGSVLDLVPVPGLSLVAKGLSVLLAGVKDTRANNAARRTFLDEIKLLDATLMQMVVKTRSAVDDVNGDEHSKKALVTRLVDGIAHSHALQLRVQTLLNTITELRECTKDLKGGPGARGFCKGFMYLSRNKATLSDMKERLASAIQIFKLQGQISVEDILSSVIQDAKDIRHALKEAEENKVLDSIPRAEAGYRCVDELKSGFLAGTREELFEELALWSAGDDTLKRVYFLSGGAGLGKSSIAHQLCTRLASSSDFALGASFFFVRGRGDLESPRLFFSSVAHQLALSQPALRPYIIDAARKHLQRGGRQQMKHAFEELLQQPFEQLRQQPFAGAIIPQKPVIIVIDALDECKERELIPDLLNFVFELVQATPWVRVFVTSRPEPHILSVFTSSAATAIVYHRALEDTLEQWENDVSRFLEETISKMPPYDAFIRDNPSFLERLINRAAGVFIFAHIAVRFLDTYRDHPNPQEQFELLLSSAGAGLSPLDNIYLQILLSAFPPKDLHALSSRRSHLLSFLTIIALQKRKGLTPEVMALLLPRLSKEDVIWMTDRLRSVLLIDKEGSIVPLHATFFEFLLDQERCINPLYHINRSKGHARLASACIAAFTIANVAAYLTAEKDAPQAQYVHYAKSKWRYHLAEAEFDNELKQQLMHLMGAQMPVYMRVGPDCWHEGNTTVLMEQWLKGSKDAAEISLEFVKSVVYSWLWWTKMLSVESPNLRTDSGFTSPNINMDDIPNALKFLNLEDSALDLTEWSSDKARYQAVHEDHFKQVRQAGLERVWFDPTLDGRDRNGWIIGRL
ncbi:AAA-16 domain-containing protein [Mycena venus]|uniref:AAA-16 domain-containing protein n=1 Tax=Mycena venus TaxID=2733690 RepID=A0A8H7D8C1_9AGAR|nr:AAA-16 domain-containing protein [Mycena venus]